MRRYTALLTDKQLELMLWMKDRIVTVPMLARELTAFERDWWGTPAPWCHVSSASLYARLRTLEARGLAMRNPGWEWPQEWALTEAGEEAIELAENDVREVRVPSRA